MSLKAKQTFYLGVVIVILAAALIALINPKKVKDEIANNSLPKIEGAMADSYEMSQDLVSVGEGDLIAGDDKAFLKITVFEDYSHSLSAELASTLDTIFLENDGQVAIFTQPFAMAGSAESQAAAMAYICAKEVGKNKEMRLKLLDGVRSGEISQLNFLTYARELGIEENNFVTCLTNQEKLLKLEELMKSLKQGLVLGSPTLLIGDEMILGARPYADFVDSNGDAIVGLQTIVSRKLDSILFAK